MSVFSNGTNGTIGTTGKGKRIRAALLRLLAAALTSAALLSSCSEEKQTKDPYTAPLRSMVMSLEMGSEDSYIRCFATPIANDYLSSAPEEEDIAGSIKKQLTDKFGEKLSLTFRVNSKEEPDNSKMAELNDLLGKGADLKTAYCLQAELLVTADELDPVSIPFSVTVGKLGSNWYICQDPHLDIEI